MPQLIEVKFKGNRKDYYTCKDPDLLVIGRSVVVNVERGEDLGEITAVGDLAEKKCGVSCNGCSRGKKESSGSVVRGASDHDTHLISELRKAEDDVRRKVAERVAQHKLEMKVTDAEWQLDRKKLTVYFTAEGRVDFRALVRDLASLFRTRIELRQVGARDEAKRLDGIGRCGLRYCCSAWLPELKPVSLALAKNQRLSLNPSQISGGCGRLLCCLRYEHNFYVEQRKKFPKIGRQITIAEQKELVLDIDIFRERVLLKDENGGIRSLSLTELKEEVSAAPPKPEPPTVPSTLLSFDEGDSRVSPDEAAGAVVPRRSRRRRRRGRKNRGGSNDGTTTNSDNKKED